MFTKKEKILITVLACIIVIVSSASAAVIVTKKENSNNIGNIKNFDAYLTDFKTSIENFILGDSEEEYLSLLSKCEEEAVKNDKATLNTLATNLQSFKEKLLSQNKDYINSLIGEINAIDTSKLSAEFKNDINVKTQEITTLAEENKFKDANEKSLALKTSINSEIEKVVQEELKKQEEEEKSKPLTLDSARALIFKEDSVFANNKVNLGHKLSGESFSGNSVDIYGINEGVFHFTFKDPTIVEYNNLTAFYYVGKNTRNVYRCDNVGGAGGDIYLIKDNKKIKTLKYRSPNINTSSSKLSSSEAKKVLERAYPGYTVIDGGELDNNVYNQQKGVEESAYRFVLRENISKAIYAGIVYLDRTHMIKLIPQHF